MNQEMILAAELPQTDASSLVDAGELEPKVREMYGRVAREESDALHFEIGRGVAEQVGYPADLLDAIPAEALASFAGVGYYFDMAALSTGDAVLDLGSGSGTDVFCAGVLVGSAGLACGVDFTHAQVAKAQWLRDRHAFVQTRFLQARIDALPYEDGAFDAVISNGVINLSVVKSRVFAEAARVLRTGGRLAIADIVSGKPLKERTRRNADLWAACIAGAIPQTSYLDAIEAAGLEVQDVRPNPYRFVSERALDACATYEVQSISVLAVKRG